MWNMYVLLLYSAMYLYICFLQKAVGSIPKLNEKLISLGTSSNQVSLQPNINYSLIYIYISTSVLYAIIYLCIYILYLLISCVFSLLFLSSVSLTWACALWYMLVGCCVAMYVMWCMCVQVWFKSNPEVIPKKTHNCTRVVDVFSTTYWSPTLLCNLAQEWVV
jgi:hypothetical protein